jgi:site-specific recombinase XerD
MYTAPLALLVAPGGVCMNVSMSAVEESIANEIADKPSPETRRSYEHVWRYYRAWLAAQPLEATAVRPKHVQAYIAALRTAGKKKGTISRALSVLRTLYGALVRDELMLTNPAREVKGPKMDSTPKAPWIREEADVEKLLNVPAETWTERRDRLIVRVAFGLGWRRAEVARVAVEDIEGETISATVKGNKTITVGLPDFLAEEIFEWRQFAGIDDGPIFPRSVENRRAVSGAIVYRVVRQMCARAGIDVVPPHALRRTNITHAGIRNVPLKERQLAVGHSSSSTTERYDRARNAAQSKVGNVFANLIRNEFTAAESRALDKAGARAIAEEVALEREYATR